jgi:O-antigen/teichoic acid export membrane protein
MTFASTSRGRSRGEPTLGLIGGGLGEPPEIPAVSGIAYLGEDISLTVSSTTGQPDLPSLGRSPDRPTQASNVSPLAAVVQSVTTKVAIIGINAVTGIITARALQPEGRGELAAMILWPIFLASALTLGVPSALTFQLKRNPGRQSQLLGAALLLAILTSVVGMLLGIVFISSWIPQYPVKVILFARIFLLINTTVASLLLTGRAALESIGDFSASNKILLWPPILTLIGLIGLLVTHAMTSYSAAIAYVPVGIAPVGWMLSRLWKVFRPTLVSFRESSRLLFSYGIRSYGIDLCGTMAVYVDQALVVRLLAPGMMGTYIVALSLSRMLNAFHASVVMVLFPRAVSRSPREVIEMTSRATRMSTVLTTVIGTAVALVGPQVLVLLYGAEYRSATTVLRILVVEVVCSGATLVLAQAFMALGRPGVVTALQIIGLALTVPLMLVLVPRLGIVGAGLALLLSTIIRLGFVLVSFPLFLRMEVPRLLPKAEDLSFLLSAVARRLKQPIRAGLVASEALER